jgi:hypothetical protein
MAQMGTDIRGRTHRKDAGSPHPAYGHPLPIGWGEGSEIRAIGSDICVHPRNLRSTSSAVEVVSFVVNPCCFLFFWSE